MLNENSLEAQYGEGVDAKVALRFQSIMKQELTRDQLESSLKHLKVPSNCQLLGVCKVNPEMWQQLSLQTKSTDAKYQHTQTLVSRSLVAYVKLAELVAKNAKELPKQFLQDCLKLTIDGAIAAAHAHKNISFDRKQSIKPNLSEDFANICNDKEPQDAFLFGNNLSEVLKASKATSNLMRSVPKHRNKRFTPYKNKGYLNNRRHPTFKGGGRYRQNYVAYNQANRQTMLPKAK